MKIYQNLRDVIKAMHILGGEKTQAENQWAKDSISKIWEKSKLNLKKKVRGKKPRKLRAKSSKTKK